MDRAVAQYAKAHSLQICQVTQQKVIESQEGWEHWAALGLDLGTRSPYAQCLGRGLQKSKAGCLRI